VGRGRAPKSRGAGGPRGIDGPPAGRTAGPTPGRTSNTPPNDYAGRLIEACGLKGRRAGGAEVSPAHANWIVNAGGATAADVLALVEIVRAAVVERFGVHLELEVKVVGDEP
jgi:UDP-N-acetylmuramate dehydrogenase